MADIYANGGTNGDPRRRHTYSRRAQVATAILGCAVIAGGAFAVTEAVSGGKSAPATTTTSDSGPTGQAAVLSAALSNAAMTTSTPTPSTPSASSGTAVQRAERLHARRLLALIRDLGGQYGQFTYGTKTGPHTVAFERGTVLSVSGADVTVRAKDGTTWTWMLESKSVVRENGQRVASSKLASGDSVFVGGVLAGTNRDAKLTVIR
jgi:hypothetical protein